MNITPNNMTDISRVIKDDMVNNNEEQVFEYVKEQKKIKQYNKDISNKVIDKTFVIQNKKNGRIIEIKAPTVLMAAKAAGWRIRHVVVIEEK